LGSLSQAKTLGGVGSILSLLGIVPDAGLFFSIPGFILVLIAVKYIAESVGDKAIFNNMIIAIVTGISGMVAGFVFVFGSVYRFVGLAGLEGEFWSGEFGGQDFLTESEVPTADFIALIVSVIIGLLIIWIFMVISAVFMRKSYNSIKTKLNVGMFGTVALLYLLGAALSIILVGFLLIFVAEILQIVAFFSIPDKAPQD
jgi:uncharacterized membrane protein